MSWNAQIISLYPDFFPGPLGQSLSRRALDREIWTLETLNLRDFGIGRHADVDDTPAGGGPGMVLRADVCGAAIDEARRRQPNLPLLIMSPRGAPLTQKRAHQLANGPGALLFCGRFEALDERVIDARGGEEMSIGDYILSGGDIAAMAILDAVIRLLPGVMGASTSADEESFENGLLEYPHFTRPAEWEGRVIPEILTSGDHGAVDRWRREQAEKLTQFRRPDLWAEYRKKSEKTRDEG